MLSRIPQTRLLLYFMCLGLVPIAIVSVWFMSKEEKVHGLKVAIEEMQQKAVILEKKQAQNIAVRNHYKDVDHFYIDKYLETLTFLEPEVESLHKVTNNKNYVEDEQIKKRLEFLSGSNNTLVFSEGVVETAPSFQETTETLVHPVEINVSDLQNILAKVEGVDIGSFHPGPNRPQLMILDFKLDKKSITEKNEVFTLNMKLLKREYS